MGGSCWAGRAGLAGSSLLCGQLEVPPGGAAEAGEGRAPWVWRGAHFPSPTSLQARLLRCSAQSACECPAEHTPAGTRGQRGAFLEALFENNQEPRRKRSLHMEEGCSGRQAGAGEGSKAKTPAGQGSHLAAMARGPRSTDKKVTGGGASSPDKI